MIIEKATIIRGFMVESSDEAVILHDDSCDIVTGACSCQPEIRLIKSPPPKKRRGRHRSSGD